MEGERGGPVHDKKEYTNITFILNNSTTTKIIQQQHNNNNNTIQYSTIPKENKIYFWYTVLIR